MEELASCSQITSAHAKAAAASSSALREFFVKAQRIVRPGDSAVNLFLVLARLAEAEWIEGHVRVEIREVEGATSFVVIDDLGLGIRERIVPPTRLDVPFAELAEGLDRYPGIVLPLAIQEEEGMFVLVPLMARDEDETPLLDIEIADAPSSVKPPRQSERPTSPPSLEEIPDEAIAPDASAHTRPTMPMPPEIAAAEKKVRRDPRREDDG